MSINNMNECERRTGLSVRGNKQEASSGQMLEMFKTILSNPYNAKHNPTGFVNVGTAENYVMLEDAASFVDAHLDLIAQDFSYGEGPGGSQRLRTALAKHINRKFNPHVTLSSENFVVANGVTSLCEMLAFSVCDPGDSVLLPRPVYQAFKSDFGAKALVDVKHVTFRDSIDPFDVECVKDYEDAILADRSSEMGPSIKILILCHPHNPLGRCYTKEAIIGLMQLCDKHCIHFVTDEIYAESIYPNLAEPGAHEFHSALSIETNKYIRPEYFHFLYGMSKDTAGGGLRVGCLYTNNQALLRSLRSIVQFHWVGNVNDKIAALMLENEQWIDGFLSTSCEKLAARSAYTRQLLQRHAIKYAPGSNAGLFLWIDLSPWVQKLAAYNISDALDDPTEAWNAEDLLTRKMIENKLFLTNGKSLAATEPGWYRFVFSQEESTIEEAFKRLLDVLHKI